MEERKKEVLSVNKQHANNGTQPRPPRPAEDLGPAYAASPQRAA